LEKEHVKNDPNDQQSKCQEYQGEKQQDRVGARIHHRFY
jgi:hypothetical protein